MARSFTVVKAIGSRWKSWENLETALGSMELMEMEFHIKQYLLMLDFKV